MAEVLIRLAAARDASDLAVLVDMAGEGLPVYFWGRMAAAGQSPLEVGRTRIMREEGAFSYRNAHVAESRGTVAGALVCYRIDDPVDLGELDTLHEIARPLVRLEAQVPGHWYVNMLAVYPEFRGQGIGRQLLDHADKLGRAAGTRGMAIIVASENAGARRVYERAGYREKASLPLIGYPGFKRSGDWILMTKPHR